MVRVDCAWLIRSRFCSSPNAFCSASPSLLADLQCSLIYVHLSILDFLYIQLSYETASAQYPHEGFGMLFVLILTIGVDINRGDKPPTVARG